MIIFLFSHGNHIVVTPYLNRLVETVQMRGHNMFLCRINQNYPKLTPNTHYYPELCRIYVAALLSAIFVCLTFSEYSISELLKIP